MRLQKIGNVYQFTFLPRLFPVNCYLVEEENELTLIDCALPYSDQSILRTANKLGKPITKIVLTHADDDHVGALDRLKEALPMAKVLISEQEAKWVGLLETDSDKPVRDKAFPCKTKPDQLIVENDVIGSLRVISTPGHTPGSVSFYQEASEMMIVGDAFQTRGGVAVAGDTRWLFPFPGICTVNQELAIESAKKIASLQPSFLATGHGNMLENKGEILAKVITRAENKWLKEYKNVSEKRA
ncbi:Glyoxylase, beta-lactamase superfamily II [Seinonella peptonophila]|uniref:Glyoxylase, beta-lactamase superfamily II n=1 Tax=Seinonella peptonophila TaxID=112248 RepID=A0A1M4X1I5_9BACL|nr:MBL fold metallo-hydrolase [Seinonella peptonophila]SHE87310.1 Glyoxylase, beta-lactamase superfamily II [Seinonella peptonophila]